jgi:hypothetical protein
MPSHIVKAAPADLADDDIATKAFSLQAVDCAAEDFVAELKLSKLFLVGVPRSNWLVLLFRKIHWIFNHCFSGLGEMKIYFFSPSVKTVSTSLTHGDSKNVFNPAQAFFRLVKVQK